MTRERSVKHATVGVASPEKRACVYYLGGGGDSLSPDSRFYRQVFPVKRVLAISTAQ